MATLMIIFILAVGPLALLFGVDSRPTDHPGHATLAVDG